jgi:hypothetical protein
MSILFRRIQPAQRFHLSPRYIAHVLKIPLSAIARIERWPYVLFVHRRDKGGQFVSYRILARWLRAIARMIQTSPTLEDLRQLGLGIKQESVKFEDRYSAIALNYLRQLWAQRRDQLRCLPETDPP